MESETDLKVLQQSLDHVTLEFFDTLGSLYQSQARLEELMRGGFHSLSRARYSMGGTRNVGALQFEKNEKEMEAVSVVDVSAEDECKDEGHSWLSTEMSLIEKKLDAVKIFDNKKPEKGDELRQRKGQKIGPKDEKVMAETVGMQKTEKKEEGKTLQKEKGHLKDPLQLFGVLVSPHLRHCQSNFKQAVAVTVEIANLKNRLQGLQQKFSELMAQKLTITAT